MYENIKSYISKFGERDEKLLYKKYPYDPKFINMVLLLIWERDTYKIFFTYSYDFEKNKVKSFSIRYTLPNVSEETFLKGFERIPSPMIENNNEYSQLYNHLD